MSSSDTKTLVIEKAVPQESTIVNGTTAATLRIPLTPTPRMTPQNLPSSTQLAGGLGGAIGSDLRRAHNQLIFVEFNGKLSCLNLFKPAVVVSSGITVLKGTWTFNLDTGIQGGPNPDIWWDQETTVLRQMVPQGNARITNIGVVNFNSITADVLQKLPYSTTPINGNNDPTNRLAPGDVFAVFTNQGNVAKIEVLQYGYNLTIQWTTYHLLPAYSILGTGYQQPEDVKLSGDDLHAYITERTGDILRVSLANGNRANATVVSSGMTAPQQIFLDEAHHAAYVVEYSASGRLLHIDLNNGQQTVLLSKLDRAIGLLLSNDLQFAYISEQTEGADKGRVSCFTLSNGTRTPLITGLTAPFFLTWEDPATETTILVPERDPANRIIRINISTLAHNVVANGVSFRPSSVDVTHAGEMLICCDQVINEVEFQPVIFQPTGPLLMGIGNIPFDKVTVAGLADTSVDPTYFYQVKNTPFGGTLPLTVNHLRAFEDGAAFYRIWVDAAFRNDSWSDEKWNGLHYVPQLTAPATVAGKAGFYPVHPLNELFLWLHPELGGLVDSTNLTNGLHTITLEFVNAAGGPVEFSAPLTILIENNKCVATIATPTLNGASADPICGMLKYAAKNTNLVKMAFTASQPNGFATYSFQLIKGVNPLVLPQATSGPVSAVVSPLSDTVAHLMGACNTAGFAEEVYVAATANNGWGRQSQYDASAAIAFVLAP
jgi:hypothetical protein